MPLSLRAQQAELVIQASISDKKCHWSKTTTEIFTQNTLQIQKIFKGNTTLAKIDVATLGGSIGSYTEIVSPNVSWQIGDGGIFFLQKNKINGKWELLAGVQGFLPYNVANDVFYDIFETYSDKKLLFQQLAAWGNGTITTVSEAIQNTSPASKEDVQISNFYPTTINAGNKEILTINGFGFGNSSNGAQVYFRDPNAATSLQYQPTPADHIISWSDTQIKLYVPGALTTNNAHGAATGKILLYKNGQTIESAQNLIVSFNKREIGLQEVDLVNLNNAGGITFTLNQNVANNTSAKNAFQHALSSWQCETHINMIVATTSTNLLSSLNDGTNIIAFDANNTLPLGYLARTRSYYNNCGENMILLGMDMLLSNNTNWNFSAQEPNTNQVDFESMALHEIGHVVGLGHSLNTNDVMFPVLSMGTEKRELDDASLTCAQLILQHSIIDNNCGASPMQIYENPNCANTVIIPSCSISNVLTVNQTACNSSSNTYTQSLVLYYTNAPTSGNLVVNGQNFGISSSPQVVTLTNLPANGGSVNVQAYFSSEPSCIYQANNVFTAPQSCEVQPCSISNVVVMSQTPCNSSSNTYTQSLVLYYTNAPTSGNLVVNGQNFGISSSPQVVTLTNLPANGGSVNVQAYFSSEPSCIYQANNVFTAAQSCEVQPCSISNVAAMSQTACNSSSNTYTQTLVLYYANAPTSGNLVVNGQSFGISGSPQVVTLTNLPANGGSVNIQAYFSSEPSCIYQANNVFTAPQSCEVQPCSISNVLTVNQTACNSSSNTYTQSLVLYYTNAPTSGNLVVNGQSFGISGSPQVVTLTNLPANGGSVNVQAYFSSEPSCIYQANNVFTAAQSCEPPVTEIICTEDGICVAPAVNTSICPNFCEAFEGDFLINQASSQQGGIINISGSCLNYLTNGTYAFDTLAISACSGNFCQEMKLRIDIAFENAPPTANDDVFEVAIDTPEFLPVLTNDFDIDGNDIEICFVTAPQHGTVTLVSGQLYYQPDLGYVGTDNFMYNVCDLNPCGSMLDVGAVSVYIGENCTPQAEEVCISINNNPLVLCPNFCFSDTYNIVNMQSQNNAMVYQLNNQCLRYTMPSGFSGIDTLSVEACNGDGICETAYYWVNAQGDCEETIGKTAESVAPPDMEDELLYLSGGFTPNGDGINDVYEVHIPETKNISVAIFDLQGRQVFSQVIKNSFWQWRGKDTNGNLLPSGHYIIVLDYQNAAGISQSAHKLIGMYY
ncbi:MAG: gliding motility-associated C-terminal domain-containing protein [Chitinophagales bacterium]|nr:gliding motility-associated C-terminal domain-containing protein [Chitinophagales bacterium]